MEDRATARTWAGWRALYFSVALATALRLFRLGHQSIWGDEFLTLRNCAVDDSFLGVVSGLWDRAFHAPLYFILAHYWYMLGDSEFMLRFPPMVFGVASVPVMYALVSRMYGRRSAGIAAIVLALSPIHIWYSQEARMYSLQVLLGLLSMLFLVRLWQERRSRDLALYMIFTSAALFTHISTLLFMAAQTVFVIPASRRQWRRLVLCLTAQALVLLTFMPWLIHFIEGNKQEGASFDIGYEKASSIWDVGYGFYTFSTGFSLGPSVAELHGAGAMQTAMQHWPIIAVSALVFGILLVLGIVQGHRMDGWAFWLLMSHLLTSTVLAASAALLPGIPLNPRYMFLSIIPFWIFLALGVRFCASRRMLAVLPAAAFAVTALSLSNHYFNLRYAKQDVRSAVELIEARAAPQDTVVISSTELGGPFIYYLDRQDLEYVGYPPKGGRVDPEMLPQDVDRIARRGGRIWLVYGRTWGSDPEGLIPCYMASRFRVVGCSRFPGVTITCYRSRAD